MIAITTAAPRIDHGAGHRTGHCTGPAPGSASGAGSGGLGGAFGDGAICPWRSDSIELDARPGAVPVARARTRVMLRAWDLEELASDGEQIVAELVANAAEATREAGLDAPVRQTLFGGLRTLLIVVWDACPDPPVLQDPGLIAESGRGLLIVAALAAEWGWKPTPERGGKAVRALVRGTRRA